MRKKRLEKLKVRVTYVSVSIILFFSVTSRSYCQSSVLDNELITLDLNNVTLLELMVEIEQATGIGFIYGDNIQDPELLSISADNIPVSQVLDQLLNGTGIAYAYVNGVIVLNPGSITDQKTLKGVVIDNNNIGIPGASVRIKGTSQGAIADTNGGFSVFAEKGQNLVISSIGYKTVEVAVNETVMRSGNLKPITLEILTNELQDVVVTGFYELPIERSTGSFSTAREKELQKILSPNLLDKLDGQLAGLDIRDGKIFIRGQNTFNTGEINYDDLDNGTPSPTGVLLADGSEFSYRTDPSQPLIVLDGFPYQGDINDINPNDIESINVLKDASSASVWGTKASNGVIVLTRKKAAKKGTHISFSGYTTLTDQPNFDDYNYVQPYQAFEMERFVLDSLGGKGLANEYYGTTSLLDIYYRRDITGELSYPEAERLMQQLKRQSHYTMAQDAFLRKQLTQNYSIELAYNAGKLSNIITADFNNKKSSFIGNNSDRLNVSLRGKYNVADWFNIGFGYTNQFLGREDNSMAHLFTSGRLRPYETLYDADGNYKPMSFLRGRTFLNSSGFKAEGIQAQSASLRTRSEYETQGYLPWMWNALQEQNNNDITTTGRRDIMQLNASFSLPLGITLSSQLQYQPGRSEKKLYYNERSYLARNLVNSYTTVTNTSGVPAYEYAIPLGKGYHQTAKTSTRGLNFRNTLTYEKLFNQIHDVSIIAGTDFSQVDTDYKTRTLYGYDPISGMHGNSLINFRDLILDYLTESAQYTFNNTVRRLSGFANHDGFNKQRDFGLFTVLGYGYDQKINITASGRIDRSNLTINSAGTNFNWSVGAGWTLTNEEFFQSFRDKINFLRLRSSFGFTGNVDRSAVDFLFGIPNFSPTWNQDYLAVPEGSNPRLKMERTRNINIGVDLHTANSRGRLILDVYNNRSKDLIVNQRTDPTFKGFTSGKLNNGEIKNTGIDLKLDYDIIQKQDFVWNSVLNFGHNNSEVKKYSIDDTPLFYRLLLNGVAKLPGFPVNSIFSYDFAGIDAQGNPMIYVGGKQISTNVTNDAGNTGVYGEHLLNVDDLVFGGTLVPKSYGGWFNTLQYKGVQLSFNLNYELGHKMRLPAIDYVFDKYINNLPRKNVYTAFGQKDYVPGSNVPRLIPANYRNDKIYTTPFEHRNHLQWSEYSSLNVISADNMRLRYINASYQLPKEWIDKAGIGLSNLTLSLQADNLVVWNNNTYNIDPQFPYQPNPRSFTVSLRGNF